MLEPWLEKPFNEFKDALTMGRAPSSLILSGRGELGMAMLAIECARLYLCQNHSKGVSCDGSCKSCLLFSDLKNGSHPDFLALTSLSKAKERSSSEGGEGDDRELSHSFSYIFDDQGTPLDESSFDAGDFKNRLIRVNRIRELSEWVYEGSVLGNGKVAVISNAQLMNEAAANALLKTFEEPSERTLIILLTSSFETLPATILSRAYKIQVKSPKAEEAIEYLRAKLMENFELNRARVALKLAFDAPLGAQRIMDSGLDLSAVEIARALNTFVSGRSDDRQVLAKLTALTDDQMNLVLNEIILELLKYKSGAEVKTLPLIEAIPSNQMYNIRADRLFDAYSRLNFIRSSAKVIPSRAPVATLTDFIHSLKIGTQI